MDPTKLSDSYEAIYQKGEALVAAGKLPEAQAEFHRIVDRLSRLAPGALGRRPELVDLLQKASARLLGFLMSGERLDEANALLEKIAPALSGSLWLDTEMARVRALKGDLEAAVRDLEALLQRAPQDLYVRWAAAQIYWRCREYEHACEQYIVAIDLAQDNRLKAQIYYALGYLYYHSLHDLQQAARAWDMAGALDPDRRPDFTVIYDALLEEGKFERARHWIERDTLTIRRTLYLGILRERQQRDQEGARSLWRRIFRQQPDPDKAPREVLESWAEAGLRLGEAKRVLQIIGPVLQRVRFWPRLKILAAFAAASLGEHDQAKKHLSEVLDAVDAVTKKLPYPKWIHLNAITADQAIKEELQPYFFTEMRAWLQGVSSSVDRS